MVTSTRYIVALVAASALAACGGAAGDRELGTAEAAHEVPEYCNFDTPGFWCGGASTAQQWQCQLLGYETCEDMCACFQTASATAFVDNPACTAANCGGTRAGGMADMLERAWGAYQLSAMTQCTRDDRPLTITPEFICPGASCTVDPANPSICYFADVEAALASCDRSRQELLKDCLDGILNDGGQCTYVAPFTCVPRES